MYLDTKLNFQEHLNNVLSTLNKTIGLLRKLQGIQSIYDYGDIIYEQTYNDSFHQKMESIQYNAPLAITSAIRSTSREKLDQELGLESLRKRRWYRKLCYFLKIFKGQSREYLCRILSSVSRAYHTRTNDKILLFSGKHNFFRNSFSYQLSLNGIT